MPDSKPRLPKHPPYRSRHRADAHASAHEGDARHAAIPDHPLIPTNAPEVVDNQQKLAALTAELKAAGSFAYDSEFIGELSYVLKLCLVQIATAARVTLIDPLAEIDLRPFWELICDGSIQKIVHAGQQDIEPVFRHVPGGRPANVFDTQIVAAFAGFPYPGSLSKLTEELAGAKLAKGFTFTDWQHRPLSASQLRYAADDVRYLPLIHDSLARTAASLGHADTARAACDGQLEPAMYLPDPEGRYQRIRGANTLDGRGLAVLRALAVWRDKAARREDVPPRSLLRDEVMLALARKPAKAVGDLANVKGLPRPVESQYGADLVQLTAEALAIAPEDRPKRQDREEAAVEKFATDSLIAAASAVCYARSIDPALVFSRQDISTLLRRRRDRQSTDDLRILQGWRGAIVGDSLLKLLDGQAVGDIKWTGQRAVGRP